MRVFLDTNVLVSATASRGLCVDVLREVLLSHTLIVSHALITELMYVLELEFGLTKDVIKEIIDMLHQDSYYVPSAPLLEIDIQDKEDIIILSSAVMGNAEIFVTGDKELIDLGNVENLEIISPRKFWQKIKSLASED